MRFIRGLVIIAVIFIGTLAISIDAPFAKIIYYTAMGIVGVLLSMWIKND